MALTLTESAKLWGATPNLYNRVFGLKRKGVLEHLPFVDITSAHNSNFLRLNEAASAAFYADDGDDSLSESTATYTQASAFLSALIQDGDAGNMYIRAMQGSVDPYGLTALEAFKAVQLSSVLSLYDDYFINGDSGGEPAAFDGISALAPGGQTVVAGSTDGGELDLLSLEEMIDAVGGGPPHALIMSPRSRRTLGHLKACHYGEYFWEPTEEKKQGWLYNPSGGDGGLPIIVHEDIADDQTVGGSSDCSVIYAVRFGPDGVVGVQQAPPTIEEIGELEGKDKTRFRSRWYAGIGLLSTTGLARLVGVRPVGATSE